MEGILLFGIKLDQDKDSKLIEELEALDTDETGEVIFPDDKGDLVAGRFDVGHWYLYLDIIRTNYVVEVDVKALDTTITPKYQEFKKKYNLDDPKWLLTFSEPLMYQEVEEETHDRR